MSNDRDDKPDKLTTLFKLSLRIVSYFTVFTNLELTLSEITVLIGVLIQVYIYHPCISNL